MDRRIVCAPKIGTEIHAVAYPATLPSILCSSVSHVIPFIEVGSLQNVGLYTSEDAIIFVEPYVFRIKDIYLVVQYVSSTTCAIA